MKEIKLFTYGTLMKDFQNYDIYLKKYVKSIEEAYVYGTLYHLKDKECPALVEGFDKVYGEVITLLDDDNFTVLKQIDELEKHFNGSPDRIAFVRKGLEVYFKDGKKELIYGYIFVDREILSEDNAVYIEGGSWKRYMERKNKILA
ncbi:gamma-glutamylcyclotransferase family protein [Fonticella tunisiensis]|uniref:Gamma-glutamylcyclotransferase (GGCT)/AIG2-like uncharacterized protein YtfP n=1 Tax=Fonticella tunisiensis TaxID=1096341 RepID=A0A4R7KM71_9CLOT|nr:gamma-glutamylcyclotransferase family protein [Fonticella tunisiensis]TDT56486.1 gamma-glutamylcyclotransferase (GGCT)/AIG2-like uncharacterized protein YtfP [Fonticella tunisiensis]